LAATLLLIVGGCAAGLFLAPKDYQQGDAFRIIYVHVPTAAISLSIYAVMAVAGAVALIWRMKLAEVAVVAAAPIGASYAIAALGTGMLWGKPMWGAYWVWDARLTSELVMLFLYLGVIALNSAFNDARAAARACAWLAVVGVVNVPIVKYSVDWWNSLHQGATIMKLGKPSIGWDMLWPLLMSLLGFYCLFAYAMLRRMQNELLLREKSSRWVQAWLQQKARA